MKMMVEKESVCQYSKQQRSSVRFSANLPLTASHSSSFKVCLYSFLSHLTTVSVIHHSERTEIAQMLGNVIIHHNWSMYDIKPCPYHSQEPPTIPRTLTRKQLPSDLHLCSTCRTCFFIACTEHITIPYPLGPSISIRISPVESLHRWRYP